MGRRPTKPSLAAKQHLTADDLRTGIGRLTRRREELEHFDVRTVDDWNPPPLAALSTAITRALERTFGENTSDFRRFESAGSLAYSPGMIIAGMEIPISEVRATIADRIAHAKALLAEAIRSLEEELAETHEEQRSVVDAAMQSSRDLSKVFIVHGHDGEVRQTVARYIEKLGFEAVILHERPNKGRTIITKFREEAAGVGFAIVLMTPDDIGGVAGAPAAELRARARQNVVFELGFFIGELGAEHVAALVKGDIERPSDFDGVVYISLDNGTWQMDLARELKAAGYSIDWNKVMA